MVVVAFVVVVVVVVAAAAAVFVAEAVFEIEGMVVIVVGSRSPSARIAVVDVAAVVAADVVALLPFYVDRISLHFPVGNRRHHRKSSRQMAWDPHKNGMVSRQQT